MYVKVDWQHTADELKALYQAATDGKRRQRLHALWRLREGQHHTLAATGALLGSCERSVQRWLD